MKFTVSTRERRGAPGEGEKETFLWGERFWQVLRGSLPDDAGRGWVLVVQPQGRAWKGSR